jgi:hypothetical protein
MHVKNRNNKNGPQNRTSICSLRKILLVCVFYKLEYLSCLGVMLPKFCKSLFILPLHHVLRVIKIGVLNKSCFVPNPVFARKFSIIASLNLELHLSKGT